MPMNPAEDVIMMSPDMAPMKVESMDLFPVSKNVMCSGRSTHVGHTKSHDRLEVQRQGGSSIKSQPGSPDDDHGQQLVERIVQAGGA